MASVFWAIGCGGVAEKDSGPVLMLVVLAVLGLPVLLLALVLVRQNERARGS